MMMNSITSPENCAANTLARVRDLNQPLSSPSRKVHGSSRSSRCRRDAPLLALKLPAACNQKIPMETKILTREAKNHDIINQVIQSDNIGTLLGFGAFGYVQAVKIPVTQGDKTQEKDFAVKVNKDSSSLRYLKQEAQTAYKISHPKIVQYLGAAIEKQGCNEAKIKIVMELMQGNLTDLAAQNLPVKKKLLLLRDIAEGLVYLHQHGLVHNDIKRDNILLDKQGRAVIGDLGRAATYTEFCDQVSSLVPPEMAGFHSVQIENTLARLSSLAVTDMPTDEWSFTSPSGDSGYDDEEPILKQIESAFVEFKDGKTDIYGLAYIAMQLFTEKGQIAVWENTREGDISTIAPELESYREQHLDNPVALAALDKLILPGLSLKRDHRPSAREAITIIDELLDQEQSTATDL